ncbi:MAG: ferritin-like domain-containing protein [Acidimicrobiales bacterium]
MTYDEQSLRVLTEESQDLQSDALRATSEALGEFVEVAHEDRGAQDLDDPRAREQEIAESSQTSKAMVGALVAGGFGLAISALFESAAAAATVSSDISMLQTAASIEVLAIATYGKALGLPFIGGSSANPVVKAFAQTTKAQHVQHLQAFNAAVSQLGGKKQTSPDPKYAAIVKSALPSLKGPADVVQLARTLELVAAETYVKDSSALSNENARKLMASIMGVEAQHVAVLDAVGALLAAGAPRLIALSPTNVTKLPAAAGSVGLPYTFWPTSQASPASEGAVK